MITNISQIKPNTLIEYKGGGYDGCFSELNYAYIDSHRKFHSILATGYRGCSTREELQERIDSVSDLYELDQPEEIVRFGEQSPIHRLLMVARWFYDHEVPVELTTVCDLCKDTVLARECEGENYRGVGGIVSEPTVILCSDCRISGTCCYCGEYVGDEFINGESGYCTHSQEKWCHEKYYKR